MLKKKEDAAHTVTYEELIEMLASNYNRVEQSIANQILLNVSNHYPTVGSYRENVWKSLFEMIVPKKYCIEQGVFIIDSYGHKSKEVDLVIFDEMYTPYIFNYGEIKFIPIEAVAAVVQCKSTYVDYENVSEWRKGIEELITSTDSVARMATKMVDNKFIDKKSATQSATRPILILCAIAPLNRHADFVKDFDIILLVDEKDKKIHKYMRGEEDSLGKWYESLNHALENMKGQELEEDKELRKGGIHKIPDELQKQRGKLLKELKVEKKNENGELEENVLLSLIFQLNQLLMVLNNPMLFPHRAYAKRFHKILTGTEKGETDEQQQ